MAIIDFVSWKPQGSLTIYAYRYPETNLSTHTQLVVYESQEAVLFSKGRTVGRFGPGKHTLNTENLPLLRVLYGLPFGGNNPFTAEIWYVNKIQAANLKWQIDRISIHDIDYDTQLPLIASGRYSLKVADAEKFLLTIVGTRELFTENDIGDQFQGEFSTRIKSSVVQFMYSQHVGYKKITAYLDRLSEFLKENMSPIWENYGFELQQFYVTGIDIDITTSDGKRVQEAISQQTAMSITGHSWQQEKAFDVAHNAVGSMGTGNGGMLAGLMAVNLMGGLGSSSSGNSMMQPHYSQPSFRGKNSLGNYSVPSEQAGEPIKRKVYCANCARSFPSTAQFCPHCGKQYIPCPACGTDNAKDARRCISCGTALSVSSDIICTKCGCPVTSNSTFCLNCGTRIQRDENACKRCGTQLLPGARFCSNCGERQ